MNIERVDVIHVRIPLVIPYETSYTPNLFVDKLILKVHTPDAVVFSECVCKDRPDSTYETPQTVLAGDEPEPGRPGRLRPAGPPDQGASHGQGGGGKRGMGA